MAAGSASWGGQLLLLVEEELEGEDEDPAAAKTKEVPQLLQDG